MAPAATGVAIDVPLIFSVPHVSPPATSAWRGVVAAPLGRRGAAELGTLRVVARDDLSSRSSALGAALARAYGRSEASAEDADAALAFLLKE